MQGLAKLASRTGATLKYTFVMGSRKIAQGSQPVYLPGLDDVPLLSIEEAVQGAEVVFLAIQSSGMANFVDQYATLLTNKTIVDVTNPWEKDLDKLLSGTPTSSNNSQSGHVNIELGTGYGE